MKAPLLLLKFDWDVQQIARLQLELEQCARAGGWDEDLLMQLNLMAEELVVNVMTHGHEGRDPHAEPGWVAIKVEDSGGVVTLEVRDNGVPYDPTQQAPVDVAAPMDARGVGGVGLHLVRELALDLSYRRDDGINVLTVRKSRGSAA